MTAPAIYSRASWGAREPTFLVDLYWSDVAVAHYNGSTDPSYTPGDFNSEAAAVRRTQNFHMDGRGWSDIAYSFMISQSGNVFEGRGWGRRTAAQGSSEGNDRGHALYFMLGGNTVPSDEAKASFMYLVSTMPIIPSPYENPPPNGLEVPGRDMWLNGHKDWKSTACPGEVYPWLQSREWENELMFGFETQAQADWAIKLVKALTDPDYSSGLHEGLPTHPNSSEGRRD